MKELYGYKKEDVIGLLEFIKGKKGFLTDLFKEYAKLKNKSFGTIRNMYYAIAKSSQTDNDFCNKYLSGRPICVSKIKTFSKAEEQKLVEELDRAKEEGKSIRSKIMDMSKGDPKLALRIQNKYRNVKKQVQETYAIKPKNRCLEEALKKRIDLLVESISSKAIKENTILRAKVSFLEEEVRCLQAKLTLQNDRGAALYFSYKDKKQNLS